MKSPPGPIKNEFQLRLALFQEGYLWEECDEIVRSLKIVGDVLEAAFDPVTGARAMQALQLLIATAPNHAVPWSSLEDREASAEWRDAWGDLDAYDATCWPELLSRAHDLNAFAYFGILPGWNAEDPNEEAQEFINVPGYVRSTIERLTRFTALFPKDRVSSGLVAVERTCLAAEGRLKIDEGESLTVHELAAVTSVTSKRLQNAIYAKTEDAPIPGKDGLIAVQSAQRWLDAREYLPSIWREFIDGRCWETEGVETVEPNAPEVDEQPDDYLFVPEARDGTIFSPNRCRNPSGGYTIGAKGAERHINDFDAALTALAAMPTPRWRRPNEAKNFGIVSAERWRRLSRRELQAM